MHAAMMSGKEDVVLALLEHNAQIDAKDKEGEQPIHYAAAENNEAMILLLVDAGTNPPLILGFSRRKKLYHHIEDIDFLLS